MLPGKLDVAGARSLVQDVEAVLRCGDVHVHEALRAAHERAFPWCPSAFPSLRAYDATSLQAGVALLGGLHTGNCKLPAVSDVQLTTPGYDMLVISFDAIGATWFDLPVIHEVYAAEALVHGSHLEAATQQVPGSADRVTCELVGLKPGCAYTVRVRTKLHVVAAKGMDLITAATAATVEHSEDSSPRLMCTLHAAVAFEQVQLVGDCHREHGATVQLHWRGRLRGPHWLVKCTREADMVPQQPQREAQGDGYSVGKRGSGLLLQVTQEPSCSFEGLSAALYRVDIQAAPQSTQDIPNTGRCWLCPGLDIAAIEQKLSQKLASEKSAKTLSRLGDHVLLEDPEE
eukprot:TRINITY_DN14493_c0_g1_i3.p1 TRINITY_DN14493_c0_g1~~TRINITY_DN14493_c0_g1_i3.p1  ORF type:complete len:344 (-),score=67.13 TRINITY_DN14493_c0_g1_i3:91-1122(-)